MTDYFDPFRELRPQEILQPVGTPSGEITAQEEVAQTDIMRPEIPSVEATPAGVMQPLPMIAPKLPKEITSLMNKELKKEEQLQQQQIQEPIQQMQQQQIQYQVPQQKQMQQVQPIQQQQDPAAPPMPGVDLEEDVQSRSAVPVSPKPIIEQQTRGIPSEKVTDPRQEEVPEIPGEVSPAGFKPMIGNEVAVTQVFNNPNTELYSSNNGNEGRHRGTDYATQVGTQIAAPPEGNWKVDYAGWDDSGWGNTIKIKNADTGETMRYSHLSRIDVKPGQVVSGRQIGLTGNSGKSTGEHLDLEYMDGNGRLGDVTKTRWNRYMFGGGQ